MIGRLLHSRRLKRIADISLAAAGIVATAPLIGAVSLAIRATMGSPVIFTQERPGKNGVPFALRKFRTMRVSHDTAVDVKADAGRLTRLGRLLRSTSIDELPTLWNVLVGDMSLVGPRPLLMQYLGRYSDEQARRHDVPPGLTGLAQVRGRNALSWDEKFALDVWYVDNWNLILDARILLETVWTVFAGRGISAPGHVTMPEFMGANDA